MKQKSIGGKRKGAGRPKGEPKEALGIRVPRKYKKRLIKIVRDNLVKFKNEDL